jgi:hypothetical protein
MLHKSEALEAWLKPETEPAGFAGMPETWRDSDEIVGKPE